MSNKPFLPGGVSPALVSPFTRDEEFDEQAFRRLIQHVLPHIDALVPCGTTGEFPYLTAAEQKRLVEIAVEEAQGKPVIAGTGAASTKQAIDLAKNAKDAGATACLVVTPYFLHPSPKGIYQHYYDISQAVDLPIILYNIPQVVDAYLPRQVVEDLADIPNVVGIKDSSGNLTYTMEILEYAGDRINVLIGHDEVVLPALAGGCAGMILASAQVYPEIWQAVVSAVKQGDLAEARRLQRSVQKLSRIFCRHGGGVPVKAALNMMGLAVGRPRRPLKSVGGALLHEDRAEIQLELEVLGKIEAPDTPFTAPGGSIETRFVEIGLSPEDFRSHNLRTGTGSAGEGVNQAQIDVVVGGKIGQLGDVYAYQLTYPRHSFEALTAILEPNLTVRPATLIIPVNKLRNLRQANMIYGPGQAAVARAMVDLLEQGTIPQEAMDEDLMIVLAAVHPSSLDRHALYQSVTAAATAAIGAAYGS